MVLMALLDRGPFTIASHGGDTHGELGMVSFPYFVVTVLLFPHTLSEVRLRTVTLADETGLNLRVQGESRLPTSCLYPPSWAERDNKAPGTRRS